MYYQRYTLIKYDAVSMYLHWKLKIKDTPLLIFGPNVFLKCFTCQTEEVLHKALLFCVENHERIIVILRI